MSYYAIITTPNGIPLGKLELWIPDSWPSICCRIPTKFEYVLELPNRLSVWSQHLGELIDLGADCVQMNFRPDEVVLRRETPKIFSCPENRALDMWRYDAFTPVKSGLVQGLEEFGFSWSYYSDLWRVRCVYKEAQIAVDARTPRLAAEKLSIELGKVISRMQVQRCLQES